MNSLSSGECAQRAINTNPSNELKRSNEIIHHISFLDHSDILAFLLLAVDRLKSVWSFGVHFQAIKCTFFSLHLIFRYDFFLHYFSFYSFRIDFLLTIRSFAFSRAFIAAVGLLLLLILPSSVYLLFSLTLTHTCVANAVCCLPRCCIMPPLLRLLWLLLLY